MGEMKNLGCAIRDDSNAINTKNLLFLSLHGIMQKTKYPGVAQLVARLLWEQDAGSSSLPTRTTSEQTSYRLLRLFYKKSERTHFVAPPFQITTAALGCDLVSQLRGIFRA